MKGLRLAMLLALWVCLVGTLTLPRTVAARPVLSESPSAPASAVALTAEAGFSGYIKPGTWIPVRITLGTSEAINGAVAVSPQPDRSRRYGTPITLARNVHKQLT